MSKEETKAQIEEIERRLTVVEQRLREVYAKTMPEPVPQPDPAEPAEPANDAVIQ